MRDPQFTATDLKTVDLLTDATSVKTQAISIRLDRDVLKRFKDGGPNYQTRINAVLRAYMLKGKK